MEQQILTNQKLLKNYQEDAYKFSNTRNTSQESIVVLHDSSCEVIELLDSEDEDIIESQVIVDLTSSENIEGSIEDNAMDVDNE